MSRRRAQPFRKILAAVCLLGSCVAGSAAGAKAASDLSDRIAPGKWALAYDRQGEFKPLMLKKQESGTSSTCIAGNPRQHVLDWLQGKGCRVGDERLLSDRYQLEGECLLKWLPGNPVPMTVEVVFDQTEAFSLLIRSRENTLVAYQETTRATLVGACAAR